MALSQEFTGYVQELIASFGPVQIRKMFGGAGVYHDGFGFGILDDDTFFIKADKAFGDELRNRGCRPWAYSMAKDGSVRDIAYWSLPETAADDGDEASFLVSRSYQIALKAAKAKSAKKAKPTSGRKSPAVKPRVVKHVKKTAAKPRAKR
jgi:DNA transformation protein